MKCEINQIYNIYIILYVGMLLMNMCYSSERQAVANFLAPNIVDPENAYAHLLPYIAYESSTVRDTIYTAEYF